MQKLHKYIILHGDGTYHYEVLSKEELNEKYPLWGDCRVIDDGEVI